MEFEDVFLPIFHRLALRAILKNTAPADEFEDFCFLGLFALELDYGPLWGCFGVPKSFQNRLQKGLQRCSKSLEFFDASWNLQKSVFCSTWPQHGPKLGGPDPPKLGPKSVKNRSRNGLGSEVGSGADFCSILGPFLVDFGTIFGRFLGRFLVDF